MARAEYHVELQTEEQILIKDIGKDCMSVTNDAEAVVRDLHRKGILGERRLLYIDSEGSVDELKHDGRGIFQGFAPGRRS